MWLPLLQPHWGSGPQPRHVPWLGIKPTIFWFAACAQSTELYQPGLQIYLLQRTNIFILFFKILSDNLSFLISVSPFPCNVIIKQFDLLEQQFSHLFSIFSYLFFIPLIPAWLRIIWFKIIFNIPFYWLLKYSSLYYF